MKPQQNVFINRTQNDTDPIPVILKVVTDLGIVNVSDDDAVVMHVQTTGGVVSITGTAKGDSSGTFYFAPTLVKTYAAQMRFEIQVTRDVDGVIYTAATGLIINAAEIA